MRTAFLENLKANLPNVRAENGCIESFAAVDVISTLPIQVVDENIVNIIEKWESLMDLYRHLAAPHMEACMLAVKDMVRDVSIRIVEEA